MTPDALAAAGSLVHTGLLDPQGLIQAAGPWALLGVCAIVFADWIVNVVGCGKSCRSEPRMS